MRPLSKCCGASLPWKIIERFTTGLSSYHLRDRASYSTMSLAKIKHHGRAFYESLGSPKYVLAPMVDASEFAWRLLTRSFLPAELRSSVLAYSPMLHAKHFADSPKYRPSHFEPTKAPLEVLPNGRQDTGECTQGEELYLDGNKNVGDRPLFVQFCANSPDTLLEAAKVVQPYCDAVDLNLGCPQGIARRGQYGAFLQEQPDLIYQLINKLHKELDIPVTAKLRIRETPEETLTYARMILDAGASIITVHGRQRHQKGHHTGLADWKMLRFLRENLPPETVIFANGNVLQHGDLQQCLEETKADGVMSAEGNLYDPSIFGTPPPAGEEGGEYFRTRDGKGGYRMDAVMRRYMNIIHEHVLGRDPPARKPLFQLSELSAEQRAQEFEAMHRKASEAGDGQPPTKKQKRETVQDIKKEHKKQEKITKSNFVAMQAHCFHMLRSLVSKHHNVRDRLARCRAGDIDAYEEVLTLVEAAVKEGLLEYDHDPGGFEKKYDLVASTAQNGTNGDPSESSHDAVQRCKRPYFVCQPYVRPLPKEALEKGSIQLSKKELKQLAAKEAGNGQTAEPHTNGEDRNDVKVEIPTVPLNGYVGNIDAEVAKELTVEEAKDEGNVKVPKGSLVCG